MKEKKVSKFTKNMKDKAEEQRKRQAEMTFPLLAGDPPSFSRINEKEKSTIDGIEQIDYSEVKKVIEENNKAAHRAKERMTEFQNRDRLTRLNKFMLDINKDKYKDLLDKYEEALKDLNIKEIYDFVNKYNLTLIDAFDDLSEEREKPLLQFYFSTMEDNKKAVFEDWKTLEWESEKKSESKIDNELRDNLQQALLEEEPVVNLEHLGLYEIPISTVELAFQIMKEVGYSENRFSGDLKIEDHKEFVEIAILYKELVGKIERVVPKRKESERKIKSQEMASSNPGFRRINENKLEIKEESELEDFSWKQALMGAMVSGVVAAIAKNKDVSKEVDYETSSGA